MKVIFRADDVGYTYTHNLGTFKALDEGVVTACDVMLDTPGFEDAAKKLRDYPWITIGWHTHFWGRPVLSPSEVPSMVNSEGKFKWRKDHSLENEIDLDEAVKECRAEIERCKDLMGRIPDTCNPWFTKLGEAVRIVCDEYGITYNFLSDNNNNGHPVETDPKYADKNIRQWHGAHPQSLNVVDFPQYDPLKAIMEMPTDDDSVIWMAVRHPGYLDDYVLAESSCTIPRVKDVEAYCSPVLKDWIIENKIELVSTTDALYGTNNYQEHLKEINSPLWTGNY